MRLFTVLFVAVTLVGCANTEISAIPDDPAFSPLPPEPAPRPVLTTGSLFAVGVSNGLYSDNKARREGDIITVVLRENTQASKKAKTEYGKDNTNTVDPIVGLNGNNVTIGGNSLQLGLTTSSDFKGDSKADQSNSLVGDISVNVLRVLSNGNLMIRGEKWLTLNTGKEYIRLTGVIRPEDIDSRNMVESTKIANARIEYSGTGSVHGGQSPGWLSRFFSSEYWPF